MTAVHDCSLTEDTHVQRIPITAFGPRRKPAHTLTAVCSRNKSVQRWVLRRRTLRSIDAKIPAYLIDFILHEIEERDLDVRVENLRRSRTDFQTMPRVRAESVDSARFPVCRPHRNSYSSSCQHVDEASRVSVLPAQRDPRSATARTTSYFRISKEARHKDRPRFAASLGRPSAERAWSLRPLPSRVRPGVCRGIAGT